MGNFGYTIGAEVNLYNLFVMPFVDGEAFLYNLGSWFVYPLFLVCAVNVLFRKLLKIIKLENEYIITAVYLAVGILGVQLSINSSATGVHGIWLLLFRARFFLPILIQKICDLIYGAVKKHMPVFSKNSNSKVKNKSKKAAE